MNKEFWVYSNDGIRRSNPIHVIEYSEYKDLEQKLAIAVEALEMYTKQDSSSNMFVSNFVPAEVARQALNKIKGENE